MENPFKNGRHQPSNPQSFHDLRLQAGARLVASTRREDYISVGYQHYEMGEVHSAIFIRSGTAESPEPRALAAVLRLARQIECARQTRRRLKHAAPPKRANPRSGYFWRTHDQQEFDWVKSRKDGGLEAFECKWEKRSYKVPLGWKRTYPDAEVHRVHRHNFGLFV
jgi:hypothetical protein